VFGFPNKVKPIAVVVIDEGALRHAKLGVEHAQVSDLAEDKKVVDAVLKDMLAAGKTAGLNGIELVAGVVIAHEPWTPENVPPSPPTSEAGFGDGC
jgi:long-chain acyl-CoA synthetase